MDFRAMQRQHLLDSKRRVGAFVLWILLVGFSTVADAQSEPLYEDLGFSPGWLSNASEDHVDSLFQEAVAVGRWIRGGCSWSDVETVQNTMVWTPVDRWVDSAARPEIEMNMVLILAEAPVWARPVCLQDSIHAAPDTSHLQDWIDFCAAAASRYSQRNNIHHYEIWNEPNAQVFYTTYNATHSCASAATYRRVFLAASDAIRLADTSAVILVGGIWPKAEDDSSNAVIGSKLWLRQLYGTTQNSSTEFSNHFDVLGYHPYATYPDPSNTGGPLSLPNSTNRFKLTEELHDIMESHGDGNKEIWATEFGARTGGTNMPHVDEATQAKWVNDYLEQWKSWDFAGKAFWYNIWDECPTVGLGGWCHYGAIRNDWSKKPAYDELNNWATSKAEYHIGQNPTQFSYQDWDDVSSGNWASERLVAAAAYFDTVRVYLHGNDVQYGSNCSFDLLNFADLPQDSPFRCLELIGVGPELSDTTGHAILHGVSGSIKLRSDQTLILRNLTFQNCGSMSHSMFTTTGDVVMDNCSFIENSYPQGIIGWGDADLEDPEIRSTQLVSLNYCTFADNVVGSGADPLWLINCINGATMNKCTLSDNSYPAGDVLLRRGAPQISNSIFLSHGDGSRPSIVNGYAEPEIDHCLFDQNTWAASYCCLGNGGNLIVNHDSSATQVTFVDPSQHDYRPRWNSIALDAGRPDSLDFDLTYQDIGWSPRYPVTLISGTVPIPQRGWYKMVGNTTLTGGTDPDLVIPDGTIILCDGAYELAIQDTNPSNGHRITVGDSTGARTSLVSHELGSLTFGSTSMEYTTVTTNGVLFNRGPNWCTGYGFVWFNNCDVDIDGQGGNTKFNDFDQTAIYLDNDCGGAIRNLDFTENRPKLPVNGIGQIDIFGSGLVIDNVTFDLISNPYCFFDHKIAIGFMNPNATANVVSNCHFEDAEEAPGKSLVLLYGCNSYWHHNVFEDVRDAAIDISCSTVKMSNIAENSFYKTFDGNSAFDNKPVIRSYLGFMDLNCGYNSFVVSRYGPPTKFVTASSGTTDWSSNFWGSGCDRPENPIGHIPTFVTNVSPTLPECPTAVFEDPCSSQQSLSALYNAARSAHTNGNYPASISYWNELLLLYPYTLNSMEACNAMKAIGVLTEFGAENYSAIASMLDTIAVVTLPLNASLSLHEYCNGLCVAGRHGDRQAVISSFDSLLVAFAGNKDELEDIQISKAEVLGYPPQGQVSALADPFATRAHRRLAIHNLLNVMAGRDEDATGTVLETAVASQPATFLIRSVHPNPFNPVTTLELELSRESLLRVEVFNLLGQRVASVHDGSAPAGGVHLAIDGAGWASGVYFVRVQVDRQSETRKILLTR
jgi:hypothetical protein